VKSPSTLQDTSSPGALPSTQVYALRGPATGSRPLLRFLLAHERAISGRVTALRSRDDNAIRRPHGEGEAGDLKFMSRVVPLLIVLAMGGIAARWIRDLLRELRHETYARADAFVTSNTRLIGQILLALWLAAIRRFKKRFRLGLASQVGAQP
jgi:hypothetical protein